MCEYCSETKSRKSLIERNTYSSNVECYIGIDMDINENMLEIVAVGEVGSPSRDTAYVEAAKRINYCPMCGRKLN